MPEQETTERGPWATEPELPPDPVAIRTRLEELAAEARAHAASATADLDRLRTLLTAEPTAQAEHLAASRRLVAAEQTAADVRTALARLEAGVYGSCARCELPIPPARLQTRPASAYCVSCT